MNNKINFSSIEEHLPCSMNCYLSELDKEGAIHNPKPEYLTEENCLDMTEAAIKYIPDKPSNFNGNGIVMCAGTKKYLTNAYVNIRNLRSLGVDWPIQIWHRGQDEIVGNFKDLVKEFNVEFVDAFLLRNFLPARILNGWELKVYAIKWCPFNKILSLDADSFAVRNPLFIFDIKEFNETGAIFFPDQMTFRPDHKMWSLINTPFKEEREFETGQIFLEKNKTWDPICLTMWMNEYSDFFYRYFHGDKESFHFAWLKMKYPYFVGQPYKLVGFNHWQHWYNELLFQHRTWSKYSLDSEVIVGDMIRIEEHKSYLEELRKNWKF